MSDAEAERKQLKDAVRPIILMQGNLFIKELLRKHKIQIGSNKADFAKNLMSAIDSGTLTRPMIEEWLGDVEGWGNQHIYLFRPPSIEPAQLRDMIARSQFAALLDQPISYAFPDDLELSAVSLGNYQLSIAWHKGTGGWERTPARDFERVEEDSELYKYHAYRQRFDRSVVRFAWRFADPYCAVMIQQPIEGDAHGAVHALVHGDLSHIGIFAGAAERIPLSSAFKAMTLKPDFVVQSTRMMTDGGYIDVVATLSKGGIADVEPLRQVRRGVDDRKFAGADGVFNFLQDQHKGLSRSVKVQGYGLESRIRVWVQCKREDVNLVLRAIWANA